MKKLWFRRLLLAALLVDTIFLLTFSIIPSFSSPTYNWYWSPNIHFGLPAYNTEISFNTWIYLDSFSWNDADATQITFNNIKMGNGEVDTLTLSVENANMTVTKLFEGNRFEYILSTDSEVTSTSKVYCGDYNKPNEVKINGNGYFEGIHWSYEGDNKMVTVTWTHSSNAHVILDWSLTGPGPETGTDLLLQMLMVGDIIGFLTGCYTLRIGQLFYAVIVLIGSVTLYNRTESLFLCSILWILLGSIFLTLMPIVSPFAILLVAFGLAGLIYKVYTGATGS